MYLENIRDTPARALTRSTCRNAQINRQEGALLNERRRIP